MVNRLLDKAQRLFKVDIRYVLRGNFWLNINRFTSVLNGLILSVAFAHLLTKEAYGTYAFALAVLGVFSAPQTTGLGSGILRGIGRGSESIIYEGMHRILPWSLGGTLLLGGTAIYYYVMGNTDLSIIFGLGSIVLPVSVCIGVAKSFFSLKGDFKQLATFNLFRTPFMTIALVIAAWFTQSALVILITNIIGNIILGSFLYLSMKRVYKTELSQPSTEKFNGRYAFHAGFLSIFSYLSEKLDSIILWKFLGAAPVAIYTYAMAPVRELKSLAENQSLLAIPKFIKKDFEEVRSNLAFRIKQIYVIVIPLILIYILAAPFIFKILFPQYLDSVWFSQLAALSLLSAPRRLISSAISAHQKIKESYIMIVLPNIIRIVLAVSLIPLFGIKGAIGALLISEVIDYGILGILINRPHETTSEQ